MIRYDYLVIFVYSPKGIKSINIITAIIVSLLLLVVYIYTYTYIHTYIHIYIYIEREREREMFSVVTAGR